jgi:Txe/YoeB family toxin of Txe-Axe toxin-antitoxin module
MNDIEEYGTPEDVQEETKKETVEETEERDYIPESAKQMAKALKQDLTDLSRTLPESMIKEVEKFIGIFKDVRIDYAKITAEMPMFLIKVQNHVKMQDKSAKIILNNIIEIIDECETRAIKAEKIAEERQRTISELKEDNRSLKEDNGKLQTDMTELWKERVNDLKDDPMKKKTEAFMTGMIQKIEFKQNSATLNDAPIILEQQEEEEKKPEPKEPKKKRIETIYELILACNDNDEQPSKKRIAEITGFDVSDVNKLVNKLVDQKKIKKNDERGFFGV